MIKAFLELTRWLDVNAINRYDVGEVTIKFVNRDTFMRAIDSLDRDTRTGFSIAKGRMASNGIIYGIPFRLECVDRRVKDRRKDA